MYKRLLSPIIKEKFFQGKALIITGARQVGKTTLVLELCKEHANIQTRFFNCDNPTDRELLSNKDLEFLTQLIGNAQIIFIDEGQKVSTIGQTVKLLVDHYTQQKQIIVTGSSSLHLLDETEEPLTGRKYVYTLYQLSIEELHPEKNYLAVIKNLETMLLYGMYPDVVTQVSFGNKQEALYEITNSYLYKDILELERIKNSDILRTLLKALALQIGSEVSYTELSNKLGINKKTVERYVDLLEKSFVLFTVPPYAKNKRRVLSKLRKIYFCDTGIRNALINNFNLLEDRNDTRALWENFLMIERMKYRAYHRLYGDYYFWRTYDGSEVDLVEERGGKIYGYEFKWSQKDGRKPLKFLEYLNSSHTSISQKNLQGFVL